MVIMARESNHVDAFDLPEGFSVDHVAICETEDERFEFEAIPLILEDLLENGRGIYTEPFDFKPTDEYRKAIDERTDLNIEDIRLDRPLLDELPIDRI